MLDIIGTIYTTPAIDGEGDYTSPPQALPGWHVNTPHPVEGWDEWLVTPVTPMRVFAGHPTTCYVFATEAEFKDAAIAAGLMPVPEEVEEAE